MQAVKTANSCCSPDHKRHSDQTVESAAAALLAPPAPETSEIKASQVGTVYCRKIGGFLKRGSMTNPISRASPTAPQCGRCFSQVA